MEDIKVSTQDLGKVIVLDEQGEPVKLSALWRERTAVIVFVRHFG